MQQLLKDCLRIEMLAREIYLFLAAQRGYAGELREVFTQLAADEHDHARQMEGMLHLADPPTGAISAISGAAVDSALQLAEQLRRQVELHPPGEEEALRLAVRLEQQFVRVHLDNAVHFDDPRLTGLLRGLGRSDQAHLDTLRRCLEWWQQRQLPA